MNGRLQEVKFQRDRAEQSRAEGKVLQRGNCMCKGLEIEGRPEFCESEELSSS